MSRQADLCAGAETPLGIGELRSPRRLPAVLERGQLERNCGSGTGTPASYAHLDMLKHVLPQSFLMSPLRRCS